MKTLNVIYGLRVGFGILAALLAALVVDLRVGDPLINGLTIGLAVYLVTYYVLKWQFMNKVEKPTKIVTMGIGAYFLVFIMCWVLFITPFLSAPTALFTVDPATPKVGDSVTFNSTSSIDVDGDIVKHVWDFGDGGTSDQSDPAHIYSIDGDYLVSLTVVDDHGISNTYRTTVNVSG